MSASDPVPVPRWILLTGGAALAGCALTLAFLAGRATGVPAPIPASGAPPRAGAPAATAPPTPPAVAPTPTTPPATGPDAAGAPPPDPAPQPAPAAPPDPTSAAVLGYLDALDTALETRNAGGDPDVLAQAVVSDALSGQTGAIDQLLAATEGARDRARALAPPAPAVALHRDTLALLDQTLRVYGALRDRIAEGDIAGISGLQGDASKLERAARAVEAETRRLRRAHGG